MLKTLGKLRNAQRRTWTVTADTRHQHNSEKSAEYVDIMVVESKKARQLEALKLSLSLSRSIILPRSGLSLQKQKHGYNNKLHNIKTTYSFVASSAIRGQV